MNSLSSELGEKFKVKFQDCQDHEDRCVKVLYFQLMVGLIEKLGWHEHTSDWDPWILVATGDHPESIGVLESPTGYTTFDWVDKDGNVLEIDDMSGPGITICCDKDRIYGIKFELPDEEDRDEEYEGIIPIDSIVEMRFIDG